MTSQAQQVTSLRELWSRIVRYLRANIVRAIVMSSLSFLVGWLLNIYVMAVRYEGSFVAPGAAATAPGNLAQGGMYWGILSTVAFSLLAYGHQAGWGKLRDDLLSLPGILRNTFAPPAAGAWSMLLWGAAISLAAGALIGPAVAGILGAGLLLMAPSPIAGILGRLISRLWLGVLSVVSPANKQRVGGIGGTIASVAGTALGMFLAWQTGSNSTKVVLAVVAAVAAFLIATRKATPQGVAGILLIVAGLVALRRVLEGVAFADDGGWSECGDCTVIDWTRSAGADDVIRSAAAGGAASGVGAALGTGLGGAVADLGGDVPPRPDDPPPGGDDLPDRPDQLPPLIDEHGEVMEVSDGTQVDADGNPIPPGLVRWDVPGEVTQWVARDEAIDLVQETRDATARTEQFDREVAAHADAQEAESRERAAARRAQEELEAQERIRERESLERWGERLAERDALVRRQELLEADSTRKNTDEGWWDTFYDEYQRGVQEDVSALPGQLHDLFGDAVRRVAEEVSDGENWRVLGETLRDSVIDGARVAAGDPAKTQEVAGNLRAGIEKTAEVAGTLYAAAENDPSGAVVGVARAVLGAENWEKVIDKDTPVGERFVRAVWGTIDTGGVLLSGGAAAVGAIDKVGDFVRGADAVSDAVRVADATSDAVRVADAASDALRTADRTGDALRTADATTDAVRAADTAGDAVRAADRTGDALRTADATTDAVRGADSAGDAVRAADSAGDAVRATDATGDAARGVDATSDAARVADATGDTVRAADAAGDSARAADATGDAARAGDTAEDAWRSRLTPEERLAIQRREDALRARRGTAGRQPEIGPRQQTQVATGDDYIASLPEGAIVDQNLVHHTGYTGKQLDGLRDVAREHNVVSGTRLTNMESMRHVRDGTGVPKSMGIKSKTIGEVDVYLGASEADRGLVGLFQPQRTPDEAYQVARESLEAAGRPIPDDLRSVINERYRLRADEFASTDFGKLRSSGATVDPRRGVVLNANGVPFAGDIDPVFFRNATTGEYLNGDEYLKVLDSFKRSGAQGQHGAEINLMGDLTRGMEPGSPEWHEAYDKALELHTKLGASHTSGAEVVVEMGPDGILRRGTHMGGGLPDVEGVRDVASGLGGLAP